MELNAVERKLQTLCQLYPEEMCAEMSPDDLGHLWTRLDAHIEDGLPLPGCTGSGENDYFKPEEDVVMFRYPRFFPPVRCAYSFFVLLYVDGGTCFLRTENDSFQMEAGDICILAPGNLQTIHCPGETSIVYSILVRSSTFETAFFSVVSDRDVLSRFFSRALRGRQNDGYLLFRIGPDAQIRTFTEYLYKEYQANDDYKNRMMIHILQGLFIILLRHHNQHVVTPAGSPLPREDELFAILNYIQLNYANLTIEQLSSHFGFSVRHMSRLVKKGSGMGFGELVRSAKLRKAAALLESSGYSIDEIASQVGYADLSGFHRAFKHSFGVSPAEHRQKYRNKSDG